jgi:cell division septation protein DedD
MAASRICRLTAALAVIGVLAGCEDGQNPLAGLGSGLSGAAGGSATAAAEGAAPAGEIIERDVESPSTFSATDEGLWDGRPSLGGVWVAHPDVTGPERVVIRNLATGKETTGALFRREREMPGPRIQVSSDAAAALGMVAGAPAELTVVAIVRERTTVAPPPGEAIAATPGSIEATPLAASETAAAAVAAVAATPAPAPTATDRPASRPQPSAAPAAATPAPAPAPAAPTPAAPAPAPAPPAAAPAAPAAQAPLAGGSFIQVGIFSQESNAEGTASTLRDAGIVPAVREQESNGKTVWRVLVGPVSTASDRAALLEQVRELGFADAYVIRN